MKKLISFALATIITCSPLLFGSNTKALDDYSRVEKIENLYQKRNELAIDFDKNKTHIDSIDKQLKALGVETISETEAQKIRDNSIKSDDSIPSSKSNKNEYSLRAAVPPSTHDVKWTSYRYNYSYRGTILEFQVVKASTNAEFGRLRQYSDSTTQATSLAKTIRDITLFGLGFLPNGAGIIFGIAGNVISLADTINDISSTTKVAAGTRFTYSTLWSVEYMEVYAKYLGTPDVGHQILVYRGNQANFSTKITFPKPTKDYKTTSLITKEYNGTYGSSNYKNHGSISGANYVGYFSGTNKDFNDDFIVYSIPLQTVKGQIKVRIVGYP